MALSRFVSLLCIFLLLAAGSAQARRSGDREAIEACKKAITIKPDYADAYYNRAVAQYFGRNYDKAWADVKACRKLGGKVDPEFLANLRKASGREQ